MPPKQPNNPIARAMQSLQSLPSEPPIPATAPSSSLPSRTGGAGSVDKIRKTFGEGERKAVHMPQNSTTSAAPSLSSPSTRQGQGPGPNRKRTHRAGRKHRRRGQPAAPTPAFVIGIDPATPGTDTTVRLIIHPGDPPTICPRQDSHRQPDASPVRATGNQSRTLAGSPTGPAVLRDSARSISGLPATNNQQPTTSNQQPATTCPGRRHPTHAQAAAAAHRLADHMADTAATGTPIVTYCPACHACHVAVLHPIPDPYPTPYTLYPTPSESRRHQ